ncbi:hypothetical protein GCK32_019220, partial [Trichostrongylus colubriformis]
FGPEVKASESLDSDIIQRRCYLYLLLLRFYHSLARRTTIGLACKLPEIVKKLHRGLVMKKDLFL